MSKLHLFSNARAMQSFMQSQERGFLPKCMLLGEFFAEVIVVRGKVKIPSFLRKIFLIEVLKEFDFTQKDLELLFFERNFLGFLETSPFLLQFFNELNQHKLSTKDIPQKDIYGDYEDHLRVLEEIEERYEQKLGDRGFYDFAKEYEILDEYLSAFREIEIYLDGFLSPYEKEILEKISSKVPLFFHLNIDRYNQKHFEFLCKLEPDCSYKISFPSGEIVEKIPHRLLALPKAYGCELRVEQCSFVLQRIEEWLEEGIEAEKIAVILPKEDFKDFLLATDRVRNLNFAMGFEYEGLKKEIETLALQEGGGLEEFIQRVRECEIPQSLGVSIDEILYAYERIGEVMRTLSFKEIAYLFLEEIENLRLDDSKGGKVRVVGVLETRGMELERAIIVDFNQENIPKITQSDMFLNSKIRSALSIPTLQDREELQKHYYLEIFKRTQRVELVYIEGHLAPFAKEVGVKSFERNNYTLFAKGKEIVYKEDEITLFLDRDFRFSASNVKMFRECKRKFYWRYLKKLKESEEEGSVALSVGSLLHHFLFLAYSQNPSGAKEVFERLVFEEIERGSDELVKMELGLALRYMQHFFKIQSKNPKILELEREFEFVSEGFRLWGRVDRIEEIEGRVRVLDYKLGKSNTIEPIQSAFYGLYAREKYPSFPVEVGFYFINGKKLCLDNKLEEHIAELKTLLKEMIEEREFEKCTTRSSCRECIYKILCNR